MTAQFIGYARVSTDEQSTDMQVDALRAAGCQRIFVEHASGGTRERPELTKALDYCRRGDVFVVWKLDRAARSLKHLIDIVAELQSNGVALQSLNDKIDTTTAAGALMFHIMGAFAEFERTVIRERTMAGIAAAKARGRIGGRRTGARFEKVDGKLKQKRMEAVL